MEAQITALIRAHAPQLLARHGVGPVTAAQLLVTAGANPDRLRGHPALAALCGASPVEASSGMTQQAPAQPRRRPGRQQRAVDHCAHPDDL